MAPFQQSDFERIEEYLAGRLSPEAKADFERSMEADAALKQEVGLHQGMAEALHDPQERAFRNTLSEIEADLGLGDKDKRGGGRSSASKAGSEKQETPVRRLVAFRRWGTAVAAMLLVALGATWLWPEAPSGEALASRMVQNNLGSYQAPSATRGPAEDARQRMQEGFSAYDNKKYEQAVFRFLNLPRTLQVHPDVLFFRGLSQLHLDRGAEAAVSFDALLRQGETQWTADAQWHLVLAMVQDGRYAEAQTRCANLVEQQGPFAEAAQKLLPDLERLIEAPSRK